MKPLTFALLVSMVLAACATSAGSKPTVPKKAIEKAADTKIADAGTE